MGESLLDEIYAAITQIIEDEGLDGVTFSSVAARCYRHKTAVAYYFSGKENMLAQYFKYMEQKQNRSAPHLYEGCDPVKVFCDFIDNRIQMAHLDLPWLRAKYQFFLQAPQQDDYLLRFTAYSQETQSSLLMPFQEVGILDEARFDQAMADWYSLGAGLRFCVLYGGLPGYVEYVETVGAEQLKKTFLKDSLYRLPTRD